MSINHIADLADALVVRLEDQELLMALADQVGDALDREIDRRAQEGRTPEIESNVARLKEALRRITSRYMECGRPTFLRGEAVIAHTVEQDGPGFLRPFEYRSTERKPLHRLVFKTTPHHPVCVSMNVLLDQKLGNADAVASASLRLSREECEKLRDWLTRQLES